MIAKETVPWVLPKLFDYTTQSSYLENEQESTTEMLISVHPSIPSYKANIIRIFQTHMLP